MKDIQKSRALQVCRMLIDFDDDRRESGGKIEITKDDIDRAVELARVVVFKKDKGAQ